MFQGPDLMFNFLNIHGYSYVMLCHAMSHITSKFPRGLPDLTDFRLIWHEFPEPTSLRGGLPGLLQWVRPLSEKAAQAEAEAGEAEASEARREDRGVAGFVSPGWWMSWGDFQEFMDLLRGFFLWMCFCDFKMYGTMEQSLIGDFARARTVKHIWNIIDT